jgi:Ran GTPase-activating protein (RanGAP) involved in mRNA processing and transport
MMIADKLKEEYIGYYIEKNPGIPSRLCELSPKYNLKYRTSGLHRAVVNGLSYILNIFDTSKTNITDDNEKRQKLLSYNQYHKVISRLQTLLHPPESKPVPKKHVPRTALESMLARPLDDAIINPRAEPVDISAPELLEPLYLYLHNEKIDKIDKDADVQFIRGTVCADGRLDLCKQVIGPIGINGLMESLSFDSLLPEPKVKHLLLGNNICGNELGHSVGKFIESGKSALTTWYIAGNNMDVDGITPVCKALETDKQVKQLWLKRNPIRALGIPQIINMLKVNTYLEVLDLTNTGLMDEGGILILSNLNQTLKYLYLASNGLTYWTCEFLSQCVNKSGLIQIGLGCNRLADIGAKHIADMISDPECKIQSLEIGSVGIGPIGAKYISEALKINKSMIALNIGFLKSTNDLKEVPNIIGSDGAISFAKALEINRSLRHLDLTYTGVQQAGVEALAKSLCEHNNTLVYINVEQFGIPHNELSRELIRRTVQKNRESIERKELDMIDLVVFPKHLDEIKSVYRIKQS